MVHQDCAPKMEKPLWSFERSFRSVDLCDSILREEARIYAARGRSFGLLGSLNVNLHSLPDSGWTSEGEAKILLWPTGQGVHIDSENLRRLLMLREGLTKTEQENLESFLLAQLWKEGPHVSVAYLIFAALHRMNRTADAFRTARTFLSGDKAHGYSDVLVAEA
jgi:hypothetical protein